MEKSIRKGSIYGFLISLALGILLVDYKITTGFNGGYTTEYVPVFEYIMSILRYSVLGALAGMVAGWGVFIKKKKVNEQNT
ncbi:hypothetical protein [Jeotgalibacillus campisalis]|uniref:Uncharacterized protein n=1 Tax=Jeotgalibacillus campisalis TaxID=220754 RepID=A0A0C2VFC3_9BACL|nr:hypothetical protein [Jeotgalibacillus campisalis]KIL43236.1 hypothetical protein KR50_36390 [Jeotgalibacillus campisalis]